MTLEERLSQVKLFITDVDGVLTDGRIIIDGNGVETKFFDVQDGFGIVFLKKCGIKTAIITARSSPVVKWRAQDLGIDDLYMVYPKISAYEELKQKYQLTDQECCFVGDDLADMKVMKNVGLAVAVKNAVAEIKQVAHYVTLRHGGDGAVREIIEMILKAKGQWSASLYE